MKKALIILALLVIVAVGGYIALQPKGAAVPTPLPAATAQTAPAPASAGTVQKLPANVGASGVYDPSAPAGSAAECAACDQYSGSQKAQCLVSLHC
jgi:hypothetical protein